MLETICDVFQESYRRGWITSRDGNASVRYADQDYFYITPAGVRKQNMQPEMFKKLEWTTRTMAVPPFLQECWSEAPYTPISQGLKPSAELPLHMQLQNNLDTPVRVVLHLHPTYTIAADRAGINLARISKEFPELCLHTKVGPPVGVVKEKSTELADATTWALGLDVDTGKVNFDIVTVSHHGVVAVSTSPWRAFEHVERLEHICKIVLCSNVWS